jgi:hypothetical protein
MLTRFTNCTLNTFNKTIMERGLLGQTGTFGNMEMKDSEVVLFVAVAMQNNGGNLGEAEQDFKMIDAMLKMKRLHMVVHGSLKKTKNGNFRKNMTLLDAYESVLDARIENEL